VPILPFSDDRRKNAGAVKGYDGDSGEVGSRPIARGGRVPRSRDETGRQKPWLMGETPGPVGYERRLFGSDAGLHHYSGG
jgi:hypothetical protein